MNKESIARISLKEFKELCGIPDSVLVWLLTDNKLPCEVGPQGLFIILDSRTIGELKAALCVPWRDLMGAEYNLYVEKIGRVLGDALEPYIEQAVAIASQPKQG